MKLATLANGAGTEAAVVVAANEAIQVGGYADVGALLRDPVGLGAARAALEEGTPAPFSSAQLRRPVLAPGAVVCVGLNYRSHILEMGREIPAAPTLFSKLPRALTDPYAEVDLPPDSERVDYEGELAFVIGRPARNVEAAEAWDHVAGLTVLNDVTMRDFQRRTLQWFAGKTFESSTPFGPWIVTGDELGGLDERELLVTVNGAERQRAPLGDLVFDVPALVADLSRIVTLQPGDLIATGTPGGVGDAQDSYLRSGDEVVVEIDGIGALRNVFRSAAT